MKQVKTFLWVTLMLFMSIQLFAQKNKLNIRDILSSGESYTEILSKADQYFKKKHPEKSFKQLGIGEWRDGEYVKYQRWKAYWGKNVAANGKMGDPTAYWRKKQLKNASMKKSANSPYSNVPWSNISYEFYIDTQIGLGRTTSLAFHPTDPNIFYVGAAVGGIWKTTDGGQTYTPLGDDLPFLSVSSIVVDQNNPNTIYIAISDHLWYGPQGIGVYKSTDGGQNWAPTSLTFNFQDNIRIYWMEADPNNSNKMIVAATDGLHITTDGFATLSKVPVNDCRDAKFHRFDSNIIYLGTGDGLFYRSIDAGATFDYITDFGDGDVRIAVSYSGDQKVYARNGTTLHKSTNKGASFSSTSTLPENNTVFTFAHNNDNTVLTGNFENYHSYNNGDNFTKNCSWTGDGLPLVHVDQRNVFLNPLQTDYVYFCNDGGVYRYVVSSNSYQNLSNGLEITQFYDIAVSQSNAAIVGGGSQDNGNVYRNANGVWDDYAATGDGMNQEIDPNDSNIRYWAYQAGGIHRWQNGNNTYIVPPNENDQGAWETPYKLDPNNSSRIIAGYKKIYASDNRGSNWYTISNELSPGNPVNQLAIAPSNSNRIYATQNKTLFVKDVSGNTWTSRSTPAALEISDLEVDPFDMNIVYIVSPGYQAGKVFKSTDAGVSWTDITGSLPPVTAKAIETYNDEPGGLFVGTDAGVFYKDDNLNDWLEYGELPHTRVDDIEIQYSQQLIRIGTHGRGVFEASINIIDCVNGNTCDDGDPCTLNDVIVTGCQCVGQTLVSPLSNDESVCGSSNVTFTATENYNGNLNWYDLPQGGILLGQGPTFTTAVANNTADFYVSEILPSNTFFGGPVDNTFGNGANYNYTMAMVFDVLQQSTLKTVKVYAQQAGDRRFFVKDENGNETHSKIVNLTAGEQTVNLDFTFSPGNNYEISADASYTIDLFRNSDSPTYPYNISNLISIKRSTAGGVEYDYYYFFYNWEVEETTCNETPRTKVSAFAAIAGEACNDGDPCTTGEVFDQNCSCVGGVFQDADNDSVCDANDQCASLDNALIGTACDDGDPCTTGEVYGQNCNCSGGVFQDADNDGVCDANDQCPGMNDVPIGAACDDGDACTSGETYDINCNCSGGIFTDADNDGVCDNNDQCPGSDDSVIGTSCNDNDACTTGDVYDSACNCAGTYGDTDGDGVCDANDICSNGDDNIDNNNNGLPDACEPCPAYDFNTYPVISYDASQDFGPGIIQDGGATVYMDGNAWKAVEVNYPVTANTVLSFDFKSTLEGEIHEVGFDNDLTLAPDHRIVVYGNQGYAGTFTTATYNGSGNWQTFAIPVGATFTGTFKYLVFTADDDANSAGNSYYRNVTLFEDSDGDLACDIQCTPGAACNDNDACTTGETYDNGCNCVGGTFVDTDGDNVCDADDQCAGTDDNIIGTACNDNDACTTGDVYDNSCNCAGTFADADGDGVCDNDDICGAGDDNADADNDGTPDACDSCDNTLTGTPCDDNDACTTGETYDANCNCVGGIFQDGDNDTVCDADDICATGDDTIDTDGDGTPDACDNCDSTTAGTSCNDNDACTTNDVLDNNCNCAGTFQDADVMLVILAMAT